MLTSITLPRSGGIRVFALSLLALASPAFAQLYPLEPMPRPFEPRPAPQLVPPSPQQPPVDPFNRGGAPDPRNLSANSVFEPATLRLMRFGEYRVTVMGTRGGGIDIPDPLPAPDGLVVELSQRMIGSALVNGQRVETTTFRYSVTAGRPGNYVMPSFTVGVGGVAVTVPAAQITVQEPSPTDLPYQGAQAALDLPEADYYVGQTVVARLLVLDSPDETVQAITNVSKPLGDFLFQSQMGARRDRIVWQGKTVNALVTPVRLTPIKPGETEVSLQAIVFINKMNAIGRNTGNTAQAILETPPIRVRVRPLPEQGRKPGFTGGIGKFELGRSSLSASEVVVGDPVTLTVTLSGDGNLEAISPPTIADNPDWQSFTPTGDVTRDPLTNRGSKVITYTLVPRNSTTRSIPAIPFCVFDPEQGQYVDLTIPPLPIVVKPAEATGASVATQPASADGTTEAANAAAPAKPPEPILTGLAEKSGTYRSSPSPVWRGAGFWLGQFLPAGALLGLWLWRRHVEYLKAHPEVVRRRAARVAARQHLQRARSAAQQQDSDGFVSASIDAIRAAAAPLDTTQAESLVLSEVLTSLPVETVARKADTTVRRLFERSHAARFSGHGVKGDGVFDLLPEVEGTVAGIEKHQP